MADRPILFSAPMIRALIDGRKTQTRRVLKNTDAQRLLCHTCGCNEKEYKRGGCVCKKVNLHWTPCDAPKHRVGDRLWVRETFANIKDDPHCDLHKTGENYAYRATDDDEFTIPPKWKPSIHMSRHVSRLTLTVTDVRVERLHDISEADAIAEGCASDNGSLNPNWIGPASSIFQNLWDSINGDGAWAANPWVAAYTFTVHHGNIDQVPS